MGLLGRRYQRRKCRSDDNIRSYPNLCAGVGIYLIPTVPAALHIRMSLLELECILAILELDVTSKKKSVFRLAVVHKLNICPVRFLAYAIPFVLCLSHCLRNAVVPSLRILVSVLY